MRSVMGTGFTKAISSRFMFEGEIKFALYSFLLSVLTRLLRKILGKPSVLVIALITTGINRQLSITPKDY